MTNQSSVKPFRAATSSSAGTSSTSSRSTFLGEDSHQLKTLSVPTPDELETASVGARSRPRSKPETVTAVDSEGEKREAGTKPPSPHPTASSEDPVGTTAESPASGTAAASLRPVRATSRPPLPSSPKLSLHEQLMLAIRDAGGAVPPAATDRSRPASSLQTDAGSSCSPESASRPGSREPASLGAVAATERTSDNPSTSSTIQASRRNSRRVVEPLKPTPREQLMTSIRRAGGGLKPSRASDMNHRSQDSNEAFSASPSSAGA